MKFNGQPISVLADGKVIGMGNQDITIGSEEYVIEVMLDQLYDALLRIKYYPQETTPETIDEALGLAEEALVGFQAFIERATQRGKKMGLLD